MELSSIAVTWGAERQGGLATGRKATRRPLPERKNVPNI